MINMKYSFLMLAEETLRTVNKPLSAEEIWENAVKLGLDEKINSNGKTPWRTIGSRIYMDIRDNEDSKFVQIKKRPTKFFLRDLYKSSGAEIILEQVVKEEEKEEKKMIKSSKFFERDLHPLLVKYVNSNLHFKAYSKTIYHEASKRAKKGFNKWLHPDIVAVYFPFDDYLKEVQETQTSFSGTSFKIFSFELKITISFSTLREYYFQAVSNSSWANEGYLVALRIDDDSNLFDELRRLNNAFGIGVIKLDSNDLEQSEIILPAKEKQVLDWDTINRLAEENTDFKKFLVDLTEDIRLKKVKSKYDEIMGDEKMEKHLCEKGIID